MPCSLYKKLFLSPYYFTIALKRRGLEHPPESTVFKCEFAIPAKPEKWYADPILIDCLTDEALKKSYEEKARKRGEDFSEAQLTQNTEAFLKNLIK